MNYPHDERRSSRYDQTPTISQLAESTRIARDSDVGFWREAPKPKRTLQSDLSAIEKHIDWADVFCWVILIASGIMVAIALVFGAQ